MIDLYTWTTPNGRKVSVMLEECKLPYRVHEINIGSNAEQFTPEFLALNPNGKIPAIVDSDGPDGKPITVFESGAILLYLAGKTGKFLPTATRGKYEALQWLMFQMASVGPMIGQTHHFFHAAPEDVPYGKKRFHGETRRLYGVMNKRLAESPFLAGKEYTVADIATFPWIARHSAHQVNLDEFKHVKRWFIAISQRPGVKRGMTVPAR